jgi:hypothetical protein
VEAGLELSPVSDTALGWLIFGCMAAVVTLIAWMDYRNNP